jgi:hypothetical protein
MTFKRVLRFDPSWPKLRLFRVMWDGGRRTFMEGTPHATEVVASNKLAVALRPVLFRFKRDMDSWRVALLMVEVHRARSWGGRFC